MSAYDTVVVRKLKLKGKPLDLKAGGIKMKKKKKHNKSYHYFSEIGSESMEEGEQEWQLHEACQTFIVAGLKYFSDGVMQTDIDPENRYSKGKDSLKYGGNMLTGHNEDIINEADKYGGQGDGASHDDHLTPAERRFLQQTEKLELQRLAKMASRSHRDRIQEFNQYLANLSEHYDIPKVGPG